MAIYSTQEGVRGSIIYKRDKRPVKTTDVPANIVDLLEHQPEVDDTNLKLESPYRKCIFDGEFTKLSRVVNQQTIYICEKDFYAKTIGEIAQQVRVNKEPKYANQTTG